MSDFEKLTNGSSDLDDELVQFTDDLLDGNIELTEAEKALSENEELRELQEMVVRMHRAFGSEKPSPAMSSRIRMKLVTELRKMDFRDEDEPGSAANRVMGIFRGFGKGRGWTLMMPVAAVAAVFLIAFVFVFSDLDVDNLLGSSLDGEDAYPIPVRKEEVTPLTGLNIRVSVNSNGSEVDNDSWYSAISADGRFVAFVSASDDLVSDDSNGMRDIFVHDQITGSTERVSLGANGQEGNGDSLNPAISADGRFVAFESEANNLVGGDGNNARDIFVRDRQLGTTEMVSVVNGQAAGGDSRHPSISSDGRFVAFYSLAPNLAAGDDNGVGDVFLFDRQDGGVTAVSLTSGGLVGDGESRNPAVSGDGQYVAFESLAVNLVADDSNSASDIFRYSRQNGSLERISVNVENEEGNGHSYHPDLSGDGRVVVFQSKAENLWPYDGNGFTDIFVYSQDGNSQAQIENVSVADGGTGLANEDSGYPSISADGRFVTFSSFASNLADGEIFGSNLDIYFFDRQTDSMERISADELGQEPDGASVNPDISADGRFVSFDSTASNLVRDDTNSRVDVFIRDRMPPAAVTINYLTGAPGSFFTISGSNFAPDSTVSLIINGYELGSGTADGSGNFAAILATDNADLGGYILRVTAGSVEGIATFFLVQNGDVRPQEGEAAVYQVPSGIAYTNFYALPVVFGE